MLFSALLLLSAAPQEPVPSDLRVVDLQTHISFLASEELEGREAGKRGGHLAAGYVENQFRRYGLKPITEDGSFRIYACRDNPGVKNWISTEGRRRGQVVLRTLLAETDLFPEMSVIKIADIPQDDRA